MAKIVFINAFEYNYLGTRLLASYLRQHGHNTHNILLGYHVFPQETQLREEHLGYQILYLGRLRCHCSNDFPLTNEDMLQLEATLIEEAPDIIGFSARSTNNNLIPLLAPVLRRAVPQALLAAGGYGPTLEPDLYLEGGFDVVVRGDGEEALLELAECIDKKDMNAAGKILNTYWSQALGGYRNPLRDQEKNIDRYPAQLWGNEAFSVIRGGTTLRHVDPTVEAREYTTFFGRGCTGRCSYCSGGQWRSLYRNEGKKAYPRRNRAIEHVIDECKSIPDTIGFISFSDEFWSIPTQKTFEFFELYKKYVHKPFFAVLQYDQMIQHRDLFNLVIDAGLQGTLIGFQTGSKEFSEKYYGRKAHFDMLLTYAHMLFDNFVYGDAQFISGNCYETMDDFQQTLALIRQIPYHIEMNIIGLQITRLRPHPKTPLTILAPRVLTNPMSANDFLYRAVLMYLANKMSQAEMEELMATSIFKKDASLLYDFSHGWVARQQKLHYDKLIEEECGKDWVYYGAGANYQRNKHTFASLKPRAILVDRAYFEKNTEIDGIPVVCAEDFLTSKETDKDTRFLIFVNPAIHVARKLLRTYNIPRNNIHACEIDTNAILYR